jgi:EF-P beta-lysylation protein EpmB
VTAVSLLVPEAIASSPDQASSPDHAPSPEWGWRDAMKDSVRDADELCRLLELPREYAARAAAAARDFPVFAPRGYIARMRPADPNDPLLRQVLPVPDEQIVAAGYTADPLGERAATRAPGLLRKYRSRVLIVTTGACAVHCRYCFRRHFPYEEGPFREGADRTARFAPALELIAADRTIREVILSGGDPLTLVDQTLAELANRLASIEHLRRLRIHTRLPVMIPERVTDELVGWLRGTRLLPIVVIHANHPAELDDAVGGSLARLADAGITLLNQSVLLAGVNDDVDVLAELSERLVELRVQPYYLHQLDRVAGATHFAVDERRGRQIMKQLRRRSSGYLVPRYVREVAGAPYKVPLD